MRKVLAKDKARLLIMAPHLNTGPSSAILCTDEGELGQTACSWKFRQHAHRFHV